MGKLAQLLERSYSIATARMPQRVAAWIDLRRPAYWNSWGGPMNGQSRRQALIKNIFSRVAFDEVVETGTFRGVTTEWLAGVGGVRVESVESMLRFHLFARTRLNGVPSVKLHHGDSRDLIRTLAARREDHRTFFYLDAHWGDEPRRDELETIRDRWKQAVIMIDDFKVPGDEGYGYARYGGRPLDEGYLPDMAGWMLLYPNIPSMEETGARRGCAILVSPALIDGLRDADELRRAPVAAATGATVRA